VEHHRPVERHQPPQQVRGGRCQIDALGHQKNPSAWSE
jgi:hypothetical protein